MRSTISTILLLCILPFFLAGQEKQSPAYTEGEVMVQLNDAKSIERILSDYRSFGLNQVHTVSERFHIYLLGFDAARSSNQSMINALSKERDVLNIQHNHRISLRETTDTVPNDTLFHTQWALRNIGQNGGTLGADIDATDAWQVTTGGLTSHGDSIVVAVVDGGSDLNHEDLVHWKNRAEIPNNNIDDDSNGFVDDYDGWNAFDHDGVIKLSNHGVHVSGIVGAVGNNEIGVSGVNWNTKILPVVGASTTESVVVEALSYVYVVRERYDSTNGAEGAFVVAVNCSFGVNEGQPEDFPIWEAMLDSLGEIGVLNVGSTANRGWDIDEVGDVPTAFETPYQISVTNTTNKDVHYANSGYGDTTIDLGAPGSLIRSCRVNNNYGNSSGTSMSSPHVSGAIALLFAAADSTFIADYKSNPGEYALKIKDYILEGVDKLETLEGKTVSEGRLNVFNSLNLMLNAPSMTVNTDSIHVEILQDDVTFDTLSITNSGGDTLYYEITIEDQPEWLNLDQTNGSLASQESDDIVLTFDSEGMDTGFYNATLTISGEGLTPQTVQVVMHIFTNVGIDEVTNDDIRLSVYPNPFSSEVTFDIEQKQQGETRIEVYDQTGRLVFSEQVASTRSRSQFIWQNEQSGSGIYFYRLSIEGQTVRSGKLLKY